MNQEEADILIGRAEQLANRINIHILDEPNFAISYMAISLIKDTMDRAIPEEDRKVIEDLVKNANDSVLIQRERDK